MLLLLADTVDGAVVPGGAVDVQPSFRIAPGEPNVWYFRLNKASWESDPVDTRVKWEFQLAGVSIRRLHRIGAYVQLDTSPDGEDWREVARYGFQPGTTTIAEDIVFFDRYVRATLVTPQCTDVADFSMRLL